MVYNTTMDKIYNLLNVCKEYTGEYNVFNYLNMTIPEGIATGILGGKWSGKSTLLAILAGVEDYSGSIIFKNTELSKIKLSEANIGYIAENYSLFKRKTALYNLTFPMKIREYSKETINSVVQNYLQYIDFDLNSKVSRLTPFQHAKLLLLRLFSVTRSVYIIDSLFDNDGRYSDYELTALVDLYKELVPKNVTVIISAETLDVLEKLAITNVAVLAYSCITDYGNIEEIKVFPNTLASFKLLRNNCKTVEAEILDKKVYYENGFIDVFELESDIKDIFDKIIIAYEDSNLDNDDNILDFDKINGKTALIYDIGSERLLNKRS